MYKFFAIMFFSLPVFFIGLYAVNSDFFFDHIFLNFVFVAVATYVAFVVYMIKQAFFSVRNDTFLNKIISRFINWSRLNSTYVANIANALAFIWVTFLFTIAVTLAGMLFFSLSTKFFSNEIISLAGYITGRPIKEARMDAELADLSANVQFLVDVRKSDLSKMFFANNSRQYSKDNLGYNYTIIYDQNAQPAGAISDPMYKYYLSVCTILDNQEKCNNDTLAKSDGVPAAFSISQDEIIRDLQVENYTFDGALESLHKVRLVTDKRNIDLLVVFRGSSSSFGYNSEAFLLPSNYIEVYDYVKKEGDVLTFTNSEYNSGQQVFSGTKNFYYNPADRTINESR
ncbi:hypothetical protein GYA27_04720 [candidate division WWE3 bacterium]|uniref:Uncharacterized protein n=1 Tax=candidate division WWE3 bacterium TaxID=2053526 RepID=A0A7X9HIB4_UNCKA|nr:hypothetical protein [candidate division WWE3 bacterium]